MNTHPDTIAPPVVAIGRILRFDSPAAAVQYAALGGLCLSTSVRGSTVTIEPDTTTAFLLAVLDAEAVPG
jgi:hypothetical protein